MPVLERRRTCGVSQETPSIRLWILLALMVVALVLSGEVWPSLMVRTTPKKVRGNLQVLNMVTAPGVMPELSPYTSLACARGFA